MQNSIKTNHGETLGSLVSFSDEVEVQLKPKDLFKLNGDARGTQISAAGGSLWVTQQGDPEDHLLRPGENFRISRKGMVVVQGFPRARLRILPTSEPGLGQPA